MVRRSRYPAGPLAFVALGMFVLTWASLRLWRSQHVEVGDTTTAHKTTVEPPAPTSSHVVISVATNSSPVTQAATDSQSTATTTSVAEAALDSYAAQATVAEVAPPVATKVDFDPVVTLEPDIRLTIEPALVTNINQQLPSMEIRREIAPPREALLVAKANVSRAPQVDRAWPYPVSLVALMQALGEHSATAAWSQEVLTNIEVLFAEEGLNSPGVEAALDRLESLSDGAKNLSLPTTNREQHMLVSRASFALTRRLLVWRQVQKLSGDQWVSTVESSQDAKLTTAIGAAEHLFATAPTWQDYLLLRRLRGALVVSTREERGALARRVLERLEASHLTREQRTLLAKPEVVELAAALQPWAAEQVDLAKLLDAVEQLEVGHASTAAQTMAEANRRLRWSADPAATDLANYLDTYYRNANVRVAISGELLNRLLPDQSPMEEDVQDTVLGARVFGRSQTSARLRVVLLPDKRKLKFGVEAIGEVDSDTAATKGPATFYTQGNARYHARKLLSIDRQGLRVWRSQADVDADSELTDLETDYDALPFVGLLARAVAKQQHDENYWAANHEMRGKVAARAEHRFDHEVNTQLATAEREFIEKLYQPLEKLQLDPTAVDLHTTSDHLIARYRVAGKHQMAAFTPRPAASAQSVLNIQLHQSTLNNVLEQLKLDGRRTDLPSLYTDISRVFGQQVSNEVLEELPEKVTVQFAERDAVRVACDGGRLMLILKLAELSQGRDHKWKNFTVQAYYAPDVDSLEAKLVRDGTIELIGERLGFRDQIALRGIFSKVLSKNRTFNLVPEKIARDPRLQDLTIEQFVIDDGWIGLSVAGSKKAGQPTVAQQRCAPLR